MNTCFNQTFIPFLRILDTVLSQNTWLKCHRTTLYKPYVSCDALFAKHSKNVPGTFLVSQEQALVYLKFRYTFSSLRPFVERPALCVVMNILPILELLGTSQNVRSSSLTGLLDSTGNSAEYSVIT